MKPPSTDDRRMARWLPLTLTCVGTVVVFVSLAVGVIATTNWQNTYELPACFPASDCVGQTRTMVDRNPTVLSLGVMMLLLTAADVWSLVQMQRRRTTYWVRVAGALLVLTAALTLVTLTTWSNFHHATY